MLSCEVCCSFRAVRLLRLILLHQSSLKKPFFSQMLCVGAFGLYFWMFVEVSCPARRQTSHCLPAEALPCCCEARPVGAGSAVLLWSPAHPEAESLSVVAGCLGNGRLRQKLACISVGTGCLGNGWLRQQWACISVGVDCLGNGGRPSPTERLGSTARGSFEIAVLFIPLG